jgi:hypothetical protein
MLGSSLMHNPLFGHTTPQKPKLQILYHHPAFPQTATSPELRDLECCDLPQWGRLSAPPAGGVGTGPPLKLTIQSHGPFPLWP